jgi:hypothetical protein
MNGGRSIDAHCHDAAGSVSHSLLPMKAANTTFLTICNLSAPRISKIRGQELLTLHWRSFSWWGRERFTVCFAYKSSQYFISGETQPVALHIIQDTLPTIMDALLMLVLPRVYPQYAVIWFDIVHHSHLFGSPSIVFIYFHLDHFIVL